MSTCKKIFLDQETCRNSVVFLLYNKKDLRECVELYSSVSDFLMFSDLEKVASLPRVLMETPGVDVGARSMAKDSHVLWSLWKALEAQLGTRNIPQSEGTHMCRCYPVLGHFL